MSTLREQFSADLKTAMKAGEKGKVAAIRLIQSALKDKDIEARGAGKGEISPDEILAMLQKMIKQRQESIAIYDANGRPELADGERAEVAVISAYLPQQMGEAEVKAAIEKAIAETGACSSSNSICSKAMSRTSASSLLDSFLYTADQPFGAATFRRPARASLMPRSTSLWTPASSLSASSPDSASSGLGFSAALPTVNSATAATARVSRILVSSSVS